jgi:hypothetical protein
MYTHIPTHKYIYTHAYTLAHKNAHAHKHIHFRARAPPSSANTQLWSLRVQVLHCCAVLLEHDIIGDLGGGVEANDADVPSRQSWPDDW